MDVRQRDYLLFAESYKLIGMYARTRADIGSRTRTTISLLQLRPASPYLPFLSSTPLVETSRALHQDLLERMHFNDGTRTIATWLWISQQTQFALGTSREVTAL